MKRLGWALTVGLLVIAGCSETTPDLAAPTESMEPQQVVEDVKDLEAFTEEELEALKEKEEVLGAIEVFEEENLLHPSTMGFRWLVASQ